MRVRLYCIAVFYILKKLKSKIKAQNLILELCADFKGREDQIKHSLESMLQKLNFKPETHFQTLPKGSLADKYAYLLRKDSENKFKNLLVKISIEEFEEFLK